MDYVVENVQDTLEENNGAHVFVKYSEGVAQIRDCVNFQDVKITHDSMSSTQIIKGVLPPEKKDGKIAVTRDNIVTLMPSTQIIKGVLPSEKKDGKIAVTRDNIATIRK